MQPDTIFSVDEKCFSEISDPLKFIFDLSLEKGIFPDDLKIGVVLFLFVVTVLNWGAIEYYQSSHGYDAWAYV